MGPGGKGTNQAIAARRGGARVALMTAVGADALAGVAEAVLEAEGIRHRYLHRFADETTGAAFIHVDSATGQNRIIVYTGANEALTVEHARAAEADIRAARVLLTQLEQPLATAAEGLAIARRHGAITILNPAPALPLDPAVLRLCDVVTPNETEIASLTGLPTGTDDEVRAAAARLREMGARNVVGTLGERGAYLTGDDVGFVPPYRAPAVVDTAGAGDAFNGALAVALAEGRPLREAVRHGCAAGALCVSAPGTAPAMPSAAAIAALRAGRAAPAAAAV